MSSARARDFLSPPRPQPGDAVAVLSPSSGLASRFPAPFELGLERMRGKLGLEPVEFPTTRAGAASPRDRARDVNAAFADPRIRAIFASIGGEDELKLLAHLDRDMIAAGAKPFFGYSDNTNLHLFLWNLGIVSYHGCGVMVELGRPGAMHPVTLRSLRRALFEPGEHELLPSADCEDEEGDWADPGWPRELPQSAPSEGWSWYGPTRVVQGPAWGGSLEIVDFHLRTGRYMLSDESYEGAVLFLETSEELPPREYVYRVLMCMGERGLLRRFSALLWARPKAWSREQPNSSAQKELYIREQRNAVLSVMNEYAPELPVVFGVEFGHTEPQHIILSGGQITVDSVQRRLFVTY